MLRKAKMWLEVQWEWSGEFCWARKLGFQVPGPGGLGELFPGTALQPLADVKGFLLMPADTRGQHNLPPLLSCGKVGCVFVCVCGDSLLCHLRDTIAASRPGFWATGAPRRGQVYLALSQCKGAWPCQTVPRMARDQSLECSMGMAGMGEGRSLGLGDLSGQLQWATTSHSGGVPYWEVTCWRRGTLTVVYWYNRKGLGGRCPAGQR